MTALCSNFWTLHMVSYLLFWPTIQSNTLHDMTPQTLLDLLRPGLRLVVCGTAAGRASAARYAGHGNRFWHVLHEVGLTATELQPGDYALLLEARIGLADLAEYSAGMDAVLHGNALYAARLRDVVEAIQPRVLAFNGKNTASLYRRDRLLRAAFHCGDERLLVYGALAGASESTSVTRRAHCFAPEGDYSPPLASRQCLMR
jgi:hypothetical protein